MTGPRLPVLNERSHAASTAFCGATVENARDPGRVLTIDGNGKITRDGGTYAAPAPNAFSLVQVDDCPGSTPTCRAGCYVHNLEAAARETHDRYRANSAAIRAILADGPTSTLALTWARALSRWINVFTASFRWHVSGDIWSREYAGWMAIVMMFAPDVEFWLYTRSFEFASELAGLPNLSLNISCDRDNHPAALEVYRRPWHGTRVRLAYYTRDGALPTDEHALPADSFVFPDYSLRGRKGAPAAEQRANSTWWQGLSGHERKMVCPVDFYGATEARRCGPCKRCL